MPSSTSSVEIGPASGEESTLSFQSLRAVADLFFGAAEKNPEAPALVTSAGVLTYAMLASQVHRFAGELAEHIASPERPVAVLAEYHSNTIVSMLALLSMGVAYAPIDPDLPASYRNVQLTGCGALLVLYSGLAPQDLPVGVQAIAVDNVPLKTAAKQLVMRNVDPEAVAYVIHTSGSTGVPKGVAIPHRALSGYIAALTRRLDLQRYPEPLSFAVVSSLAADLAYTCIFPALTTGGTLHLVEKARVLDGTSFSEYMQQHRIDVLKIVPSHLRALLSKGREILPSKLLVVGGETFTEELYTQLMAAAPSCRIVNHYGPTEATVGCLTHELSVDEVFSTPPIASIGRPVQGCSSYVLDDSMELIEPDASGELYIGGSHLAIGYLGNAVATAERFLPDPFSEIPGARLYRSGDVARQRLNGDVYVSGRQDQQVKVRGYRVELGEVESLICGTKGVEAACVLAQAQPSNGTVNLTAFIVPVSAAEEGASIEVALKQRMPAAMMPSRVVWLDQLPLTSNGKVDRRRLSEISFTSQSETPAVAVLSLKEAAIAQIWKEVLGCPLPTADQNFFDLGGDSIGVIRIAALLRKKGIKITPIQIFQHPRLGDLAEIAIDSRAEPMHASKPPVSTFPLSATQEGILFECFAQPGRRLYISHTTWTLGPELDVSAFIKAWQAVVSQQTSLRTGFHLAADGSPQQTVLPELELSWQQLDWSDVAPQQVATQAQQYFEQMLSQGLDLQKAPLLRVGLARLGTGEYLFLFLYHHLVMDGWSEGLLFDQLEGAYRALRKGKSAPEVNAAPYSAFIDWLHARNAATTKEFWKRYLLGVSTGSLGALVQSRASDSAAVLQERIPATIGNALRDLARRQQVTLNTLIQACWAVSLCSAARSPEVVLGVEVALRPVDIPALQKTIGLFLNLLPVRVPLPAGTAVGSWLRSLQEQNVKVREAGDLSLVEIQRAGGVQVGTPLFDSLIAFQSLTLAPEVSKSGEATAIPLLETTFEGGPTNYALSLDVEPHEEMLVALSFDTGRVSPGIAHHLLQLFEEAVVLLPEYADGAVDVLRETLAASYRKKIAMSLRPGTGSLRRAGTQVSS